MISNRDAYLLERFFSDGRSERSPLGGMLDAVERYAPRYHERFEPEVPIAPPKDHARNCWCELCKPSLDAKPTAELKEATREGPDEERLSLLSHVSRRLSVVRKADPLSFQVLEAFYGDSGARWVARDKKFSRLDAVLKYTASGRAQIDRDKKKSRGAKLELSDDARLENIAADVENVVVKPRIDQARMEAVSLYDRACEAWNATAPARKAVT
jgi:hypothetical protein